MTVPANAIDVVIVNYRGVDDTLLALQRLGNWHRGRIFVVDNSAHLPDEAEHSAKLKHACNGHPTRQYLCPQDNLGFGRACNLAFSQSDAPFFLLLNPDALVAPAEVETLAAALEEQPALAAVSPKTFWNSARTWVLPKPFGQTPWHTLAMALGSRWPRAMQWVAQWAVRRSMRQMDEGTPFTVDFLAGAVLVLRRAAVLQAGGLFDPRFFMFFEDADLSVRLRKAGYRLALVPGAEAVHTYRHKAFKAELMETSHRQYLCKHHHTFYHLSGQLKRVAWLHRTIDVKRWFETWPHPVRSTHEFNVLSGHAPVLAWSPSMQMMPALVRPAAHVAAGWSDAEWDLLEPAAYTALLGDAADPVASGRWIYFEKA